MDIKPFEYGEFKTRFLLANQIFFKKQRGLREYIVVEGMKDDAGVYNHLMLGLAAFVAHEAKLFPQVVNPFALYRNVLEQIYYMGESDTEEEKDLRVNRAYNAYRLIFDKEEEIVEKRRALEKEFNLSL